jgi:hypothetical protein
MKQSMMIIKSDWNQQPTFKMIPVDVNCPYVECIYDPQSKVLALIGVTKKNVFHMMPKLDDNGELVPRKTRTEGSKNYKEERRTIETFQEYYISDLSQISEFLEMFSVNPSAASEFLTKTDVA